MNAGNSFQIGTLITLWSAAILTSSPTSAVPITTAAQTASYSIQSSATQLDSSQTLQFLQFDPLLGNLLAVELSVIYDGVMNVNMTGHHQVGAAETQPHGLNLRSRLSLTEVSLGIDRGTFAGLVRDPLCETLESGPIECTSNEQATNINNLPLELTVSDAAVLQAWMGSGFVGISPNAIWSSYIQVGSPTDIGSVANWEGSIAIRYRYDAGSPAGVPEPATLALLSLGLAGLAAATRRKQ